MTPAGVTVSDGTTESQIDSASISITGPGHQSSYSYDAVTIDGVYLTPMLLTIDGVQYYVLAAQV